MFMSLVKIRRPISNQKFESVLTMNIISKSNVSLYIPVHGCGGTVVRCAVQSGDGHYWYNTGHVHLITSSPYSARTHYPAYL